MSKKVPKQKLILLLFALLLSCFAFSTTASAAADVRTARFEGVKIYSEPEVNALYVVDTLNKGEEVEVLEVKIYDGIEFARVEKGYIVSIELLGGERLSMDLREGAKTVGIKNQTKVFESASTQSEIMTVLQDNTRLKITAVEGKFCLIEVIVDGESVEGYVESKFLVVDGFSNMQKLGVVVLISMVLLFFITILVRFKIVK